MKMKELRKTTINLPVDLKNQVKSLAKQQGTTMSALILEMLQEGYESRKK